VFVRSGATWSRQAQLTDTDGAGQAKKLYDALTCEKEYMLFTAEEGAGDPCQLAALLLRDEQLYAWLDRQMR
jgi:hypothetical protein